MEGVTLSVVTSTFCRGVETREDVCGTLAVSRVDLWLVVPMMAAVVLEAAVESVAGVAVKADD